MPSPTTPDLTVNAVYNLAMRLANESFADYSATGDERAARIAENQFQVAAELFETAYGTSTPDLHAVTP